VFFCSLFCTAAFHVTKDDTRDVLREITLSPTVVFPVSFSFAINASDYHMFSVSNAHFFESFFKNITDGITDGFEDLLSSRNGSVFSLPLDLQIRVAQESNQVLMEGSALVIALNATEPSSYDGWSDLAIAAFHSKASSSALRNLASPHTFKARFFFATLCCMSCQFAKFCQTYGISVFQHLFSTL
jgi:hypothetical protein